MTILEYGAQFYELSRHATSILTTKYERVQCFVWRLRLPLCMDTQSFVVTIDILLRFLIILRL